MRTLICLILAVIVLAGSRPATAEDVFDRLQNESVSVMDFGIKRLRSSAIDATRRLATPSDTTPQASVLFDTEKRAFNIQFILRTSAEPLTMTACQERRIKAIKEIFMVDATAYAAPVSTAQKIVLRLGRIFTREPIAPGESIQAMGERLAQSTNLKLTLTGADAQKAISCDGRVTDLRTP